MKWKLMIKLKKKKVARGVQWTDVKYLSTLMEYSYRRLLATVI